LVLIIMIDALGHRLVGEWDAFKQLSAPDGPVPSVCGYSSACVPSLLTGRYPVEHGHWAMYLRDPQRSLFKPYAPFLWLASGLLGRNGFTRRWISRALWHRGITGYFSLYEIPPYLLPHFDLCQKQDIYQAGAFPGIETPFDVADRLGLAYRIWTWNTPEQENRTGLEEAIERGEDDFLFFYSPGLDSIMHAHGTRSPQTQSSLQEYEAFTYRMLERAQTKYREVRLLVFGDHGMADVHASHDIMGPLKGLGLRVPQDCLYFIDSTMARFWFFESGVREQVEALLRSLPGGRIVEDPELERLGILFPDRRYGEMLFLADAGELFVPSFMGRTGPRAMHGYHPQHVDSDTIVLGNYAHAGIGSIMDIGPLISAELEGLAG
jgi:hypothetical protein